MNGVDPLGLWGWNPISDAEQAAGDVHHDADDVGHFLKDPNRWRAETDYLAGIGNAVVSTVTLGHVHIAAPYCGYGVASDIGNAVGLVALTLLSGGAGEAADVATGAKTVEEVEAGGQAVEASGAIETGSRPASVFWSGGDAARAAATDYATSTGGVTLGMTPAGQALEVATQGMDYVTEARPLWAAASREFAAQASGEVHVFQNAVSVSKASIWATDEYPELRVNPNVGKIVCHLVSC